MASSLACRSSASAGFLTDKRLSLGSTGPPPLSPPSPLLNDLPVYPPLSISSSPSDPSSLCSFFHRPSLLPPLSFGHSETSSSSGFISTHSDDEEDEEVSSSSSSLSSSQNTASSSSSSPQHNQNGPLDSFDAISSALPIKRGLSRYFAGKSQSFSCLARVSSVADLAKPENPLAKRRRIAAWQRSSDTHPRHSSYPPTCGAISKRSNAISSRSHLRSPKSLAPFPPKCLSVSELQKAGAAL